MSLSNRAFLEIRKEKSFSFEEFRRRVNATRALSTPFDEEKVSLQCQKYRTWPKTNDRNDLFGYVYSRTAKETVVNGQIRG